MNAMGGNKIERVVVLSFMHARKTTIYIGIQTNQGYKNVYTSILAIWKSGKRCLFAGSLERTR